ncbi:MAG: hypothetical protein VZQ51_09195, partial [Bacteroidales bacterium]|nr:hypothetical protein [Bacteroidales bacterium]
NYNLLMFNKLSVLFYLIFLFNPFAAFSQSIETIANSRAVTMGGSLAFNDNLEFLTDSISNYYCLSGSYNTKFFGVVDVPVSFAYTNNTLTKNLALPFNRFSLNPSYKEYTLYAGFNSMNFSKFTMSGHDYFGGGFAYSGEVWTVETFFGRLRKAVQPDSLATDVGYARLGGGLKIGYKSEKYNISANVIKIKDRKKSVNFDDYPDQFVFPKDNIASSIAIETQLFGNLTVSGEYAVSSVQETGQSTAESQKSKNVVYQAVEASFAYSFENSSIGVSYDRLPPDYETLGGYYFSEDEEQISMNLATTIAEKYQLSGDFGYRHDNVDNQQVTTNKSFAYSLNLSATPIERLSVAAGINNDQSYVNLKDNLEQLTMMSDFEDLDTNEYSRLNLTTNLNVNYTMKESEILSNSFYTSFSYNTTSDKQRYDTTSANSRIYNLNFGTNTVFKIPKISVGFNVGLSQTDSYSQCYKMLTLTGSLSKNFENGISLSGAYTYAGTKSDTLQSAVTNVRISASYALFKKHNLGLTFCYIHNPMSKALKNRYTLSVNYSYGFTIIGDKKKGGNE